MAALGTVGVHADIVPGLARTFGTHIDPSAHPTVRNENNTGILPGRAGGLNSVAVDVIPIIVANYGQAAGGISIW